MFREKGRDVGTVFTGAWMEEGYATEEEPWVRGLGPRYPNNAEIKTTLSPHGRNSKLSLYQTSNKYKMSKESHREFKTKKGHL